MSQEEVQRLDAAEQQLLKKVDLLRVELANAEAELEDVRAKNMEARREILTSEPPAA